MSKKTKNPVLIAREALQRLNPYKNKGLAAFDSSVLVVTQEGSFFLYKNATAETWKNPSDSRLLGFNLD